MTADPYQSQAANGEHAARYSMQTLFEPIGLQGQEKLLEARAVLFGCGGRGSVLADLLARAGVGFIRLVDRDYIEMRDLQRSDLFDEDDIASNLPKAEAARRKLQRVNSDIRIESTVAEVNPHNIKSLAKDAQLILDGTSNFHCRYLINDFAVQNRIPWIFGATVAGHGMSMPILPQETPCLRCIFPDAPPAEQAASVYNKGVLTPVIHIIAAHQALQAIKYLTGHTAEIERRLLNIQGWEFHIDLADVQHTRDQGDCICCKQQHYEFLEGKVLESDPDLEGRNAVYLRPREEAFIDFPSISDRIQASSSASFSFNPFMLKAYVNGLEFVLFPDGRAIIKGTHDRQKAEALYMDFVGKEM